MTAYYNEIDKNAAAWLRELIKAGLIAPGEVDNRSIEDVLPSELAGFAQVHCFAGIGVWSYSLRQAGWPDDRPIWTGSCPCQPFSSAGKGKGFADERHLWPDFFRLIRECRPIVVFGEQVASKDGLTWLDTVCADLERENYTIGAVDTCAAGFGAPHIRQRLYWVAHSEQFRRRGWSLADDTGQTGQVQVEGHGASGGLGDAQREGLEGYAGHGDREAGRSDAAGSTTTASGIVRSGATNGFWRDADWIFCRDGKWRPVEPGTSPLAHGVAARVGLLRGYGNAICAPQAQAFIEAVMEAINV